jgi:hypothetical protein
MRHSIVFIACLTLTLIITLTGCAHRTTPATAPEGLTEFVADLKRDIPLRAGMTVEEVKNYIAVNNEKVRSLESSNGKPPPIFARPELHLYVFMDMDSQSGPTPRSLTYLANGRYQFWMDLAIQDGHVKNIYVAPGNLSNILLPAFLYDGTGEHVGRLAGEK